MNTHTYLRYKFGRSNSEPDMSHALAFYRPLEPSLVFVKKICAKNGIAQWCFLIRNRPFCPFLLTIIQWARNYQNTMTNFFVIFKLNRKFLVLYLQRIMHYRVFGIYWKVGVKTQKWGGKSQISVEICLFFTDFALFSSKVGGNWPSALPAS